MDLPASSAAGRGRRRILCQKPADNFSLLKGPAANCGRHMTQALFPMAFAVPAQSHSGIPRRITIPAGAVMAANRLFIHSRTVLGIYLSGQVAIVRIPRLHSQDPANLMEQLVGWLSARGYSVLRLKIFFPVVWSSPRRQTPVRVEDSIVHSARTHLARLSSEYPRDLPLTVRMPSAVRDVLRAGARFWRETATLLHGLEKTDSNLMIAISPTLIDVAKTREIRIARLEERAKWEGWINPGDINRIAACDRAWKTSVDYVSSYSLLDGTIARLL